MRTIERRIGLLFAGFLLCFLIVAVRAVWLQGVQGAQLASEAAYQQTEEISVPGLRGSLLDRYGNPLAVSEDAATIYATPYQVKNPPQIATELARVLEEDRDEVLDSLTEDSGFSYVAQKVDVPDRGADRAPGAARHRPAARQQAHLPAGRAGGAGARCGRGRKRGPHRPRGR